MKKLVMDLPEINDYRMVEGLNQLKTNLAFCGKDIKVITMTSSVPNEGKSSISLSLSRTLAESGKKILMVDADLRKSVMAARYHIQGIDKGLSHYLTGQAEVEDIIYETEVEGLCITVAGPLSPDPTSILDSEQFEQFIENVRDSVTKNALFAMNGSLVLESAPALPENTPEETALVLAELREMANALYALSANEAAALALQSGENALSVSEAPGKEKKRLMN